METHQWLYCGRSRKANPLRNWMELLEMLAYVLHLLLVVVVVVVVRSFRFLFAILSGVRAVRDKTLIGRIFHQAEKF